jgi:hypothetical protein
MKTIIIRRMKAVPLPLSKVRIYKLHSGLVSISVIPVKPVPNVTPEISSSLSAIRSLNKGSLSEFMPVQHRFKQWEWDRHR